MEEKERKSSKLELKKRERDTKEVEKKEVKPVEKKPKEIPKMEGMGDNMRYLLFRCVVQSSSVGIFGVRHSLQT